MINFDDCGRSQLEEVVEALAYKIARYENPSWFCADESTVLEILECEGLKVKIE